MAVVVVVTLQLPRIQLTVVRVVVLVLFLVVRREDDPTMLVLVQLDLHAKGMMVV